MTDHPKMLDYGLRRRADARLGGRGWPYGTTRPVEDADVRLRLLDWMEANDLYQSQGRMCLHWLRSGRCLDRNGCDGTPGADWADHLSSWRDAMGTRVLVAQPYELDAEDRAELACLNGDGIEVEVDLNGGWYGHGTAFVALWRRPGAS